MNDLFPIPQQEPQSHARHVCQFDWTEGRNEMLVCGENKNHRMVLLSYRRAKVLAELKADGALVGRALSEAEAVGAQPAEDL